MLPPLCCRCLELDLLTVQIRVLNPIKVHIVTFPSDLLTMSKLNATHNEAQIGA